MFSYSAAQFAPCDSVPIPEAEMETAALWVGLCLSRESYGVLAEAAGDSGAVGAVAVEE